MIEWNFNDQTDRLVRLPGLSRNHRESETLLTPQGWVNYLNVDASLQATNGENDDRSLNAGRFANGQTNLLKVMTSKFLHNGWVRLVMKPHLEVFLN